MSNFYDIMKFIWIILALMGIAAALTSNYYADISPAVIWIVGLFILVIGHAMISMVKSIKDEDETAND